MKSLLTGIFAIFMVLGCERQKNQKEDGKPDSSSKVDLNKLLSEALPLERLQERSANGEKLFFEPNEEEPYAGWVLKMYPGNSQVNILSHIEDGKKTVWWEFYSFVHTLNFLRPKFDRKEISINYKDGKEHGLFEKWYATGKPSERGNYEFGLKAGEWVAWHQSGTMLFRGNFNKGKEEGIHSYWWKTGRPQKSHSYKLGTPNGTWWEAFQNGQKKFEGNYREGEKHGVWNYWQENGEKAKFEKYQNGQLVEN